MASTALQEITAINIKVAAAVFVAATLVVAGAGGALQQVQIAQSPDAKPQQQAAANVADQPKDDGTEQVRTDLYDDPLPPGAVARLGTMRFRNGPSSSAAFSPDGKMVATGSDVSLRLWDVASGKLVWQTRGNYRSGLRFSHDGKRLAVSGKLLDAAAGQLVRRLRPGGSAFAFSPDSTLLATGSHGGPVTLSHTTTGAEAGRLQGKGWRVLSFVFTPDGEKLIAAFDGKRIYHWDVAACKLLKTVELPLPTSGREQLSPDGRTLAVNPDRPEPVSLWDTDTGKQRCQLQGDGAHASSRLAYSPDSRMLATDLYKSPDEVQVSVWDAGTGKLLRRFAVPYRAALRDLQWSPDGRTLLSSGTESRVRLWDSFTGKCLFEDLAHDSPVQSLSFAADRKTLVSASSDGTVRVWDVATSRHLRELTAQKRRCEKATLLPDGSRVLSGSPDGRMWLQDLQTGKELYCLIPDPEDTKVPYRGAVFAVSTDGRSAASVVPRQKGKLVHVWDLATGRALVSRTDRLPTVFPVFSPDTRTMASDIIRNIPPNELATSGLQMIVQDVATGKQLLTTTLGVNTAKAFSPDGRTLFTITWWNRGQGDGVNVGAYTCRLWELASGKERLTLTSSEPADEGPVFRYQEKTAFAPDGRSIAISFPDGTIRLLDTATLKERVRYSGYDSRVGALAFSPDGKTLASGHLDSTILFWELTPEWSQRPPVAKATAQQLDTWWTDLAEVDARKAHAAIWNLAAVPHQAVALLRNRLHPATAVPADRLQQLISDLDSNHPQRREAASQQLAELGEQAEPALSEALNGRPSPEQRRRIEALLAGPMIVRSPENLRHLRAVEVLELSALPEATQHLGTLAKGASEARLTREAQASLERLAKRPAATP